MVVGAGLAGLRAAWDLARRGCEVTVLEARDRPGGRARGEVVEGFHIGRALPLLGLTDARLLEWVRALGLGSTLLPMRAVATAHVHRGRIVACDSRTLGGLARTPGLGWREGVRLLRLPRLMARYAPLLDPDAPERAAELDWRSLSDFARLYFGPSFVDRFAGPFTATVTGGDASSSSRVAFLHLWHASRQGRSIPGVAAAGLHEIVDPASSGLGLRTQARVTRIDEADAGALSVEVQADEGSERIEADAVVVATSGQEAGRIAARLVTPPERDFFAALATSPQVLLGLAVDRPITGLPQLVRVPHVEGSPIEAILVEPGLPGSRAPEGSSLVSVAATTRFAEETARAADDVVAKSLVHALERLYPSATRRVRFERLHREPAGRPSFEVGTYNKLARFRRVQNDRRGLGRRLYWAGDYLCGPRFEDAVSSGRRAALEAATDLGLDTPRAASSER